MNKIENELRDLIILRYGTINNFCKKEGVANSTISTIFSRGVQNANVTTIIRICKALHISTDALAEGQIVFNSSNDEEHLELTDLITMLEVQRGSLRLSLDGRPLEADDIDDLIRLSKLSVDFLREKFKFIEDRLGGESK